MITFSVVIWFNAVGVDRREITFSEVKFVGQSFLSETQKQSTSVFFFFFSPASLFSSPQKREEKEKEINIKFFLLYMLSAGLGDLHMLFHVVLTINL